MHTSVEVPSCWLKLLCCEQLRFTVVVHEQRITSVQVSYLRYRLGFRVSKFVMYLIIYFGKEMIVTIDFSLSHLDRI
jgi:hypothetical protein